MELDKDATRAQRKAGAAAELPRGDPDFFLRCGCARGHGSLVMWVQGFLDSSFSMLCVLQSSDITLPRRAESGECPQSLHRVWILRCVRLCMSNGRWLSDRAKHEFCIYRFELQHLCRGQRDSVWQLLSQDRRRCRRGATWRASDASLEFLAEIPTRMK